MLDVEKLISGIHEWTAKEVVAPLVKRIKALEDRALVPGPQGERGEKGIDGADGKDGVAGEPGPQGEKGEKGDVGLQGPVGAQGEPGRDGERGEIGLQGIQGEKGEAGARGEKGEPGLNGKDGEPGPKGDKGEQGPQGEPGRDGADGKSVTVEEVRQMFEGEFPKWALDFERRAQDVLQKAIDRIPAPKDGINGKDGIDGINGKDGAPGQDGISGKDGVDGLGFDNVEVVADGERRIIVRFASGSKVKEFPLNFPVLIDRGVYKPEGIYEKGDGVTYGGSFWISQKDRPESRPGAGPDWRLAVKRGRDGKDIKEGEPA